MSPALGAAEGHQSGRSIPSVVTHRVTWRVDQKVGKAPSSLMSVGRLSQGGQWPMYPHQVARLLCCALLSERGVVQHQGGAIRSDTQRYAAMLSNTLYRLVTLFDTMRYNAIQCDTMRYNAIHFSRIVVVSCIVSMCIEHKGACIGGGCIELTYRFMYRLYRFISHFRSGAPPGPLEGILGICINCVSLCIVCIVAS